MSFRTLAAPASARASAARYLSCLRLPEILVLQGSPLLGAVLVLGRATEAHLESLVLLLVANFLLVAHVFLLNDWAGETKDLVDPHKASAVFTARGVASNEIGLLALVALTLSLVLMSRLGALPLGLAAGIAALSAFYSLPRLDWKGKPFFSSAAHLAGGTLHFLLGASLAGSLDLRGLAVGAFFGITFAAGHLTQEVRDHEGDVLNGVRTHAARFGPRRTFGASLALFAVAYALLPVLAFSGFLPLPLAALAALSPLHLRWAHRAQREGLGYASIHRLQTRYRALYAVIGCAMLIAFWRS